MKQLAMCLAPILIVVVYAAMSPRSAASEPGPAATRSTARTANPVPGASFQPCAPGSQGTCSGKIFGTQCGTNPDRFCLPLQQLPGGGELCRCGTL